MRGFLKKICSIFSQKRTVVSIKDIDNSPVAVTVINDSIIVNREKFEIIDDWFEQLLAITYDDEIKSKYIPILHQSNDFEREQLKDILEFHSWRRSQANQIRICLDYLKEFKISYDEFHQILVEESINITNPSSPLVTQINTLNENLDSLTGSLMILKGIFEQEGYQILTEIPKINLVPKIIENAISYREDKWSQFLDKEPSEFYTIALVFRRLNEVYYNLGDLNRMLENLKSNVNHKIIAGNAGTGKTHISAHLINSITQNGDYVIFLKPKLFNGDNINFEERILQLLQIPTGYTLNEILVKINDFAIAQNKRCFILIDALNETTRSSIGFSNIWNIHLQSFINHIGLFPNLYFIATLRTSYIEHMWPIRPSHIIEIKGFNKNEDVEEACEKYFDYYKIKPNNYDTADLSYFEVPLLLDLFCKLTNPKRETEKEVALDIHSYLQVFENYISELVIEVKNKLDLLKDKPIINGFSEIATKFWDDNEAIVYVDDFNDAFDKDDLMTRGNSIAKSVLEGYLIFIKDFVEIKKEVVKHTQQEVGGYLLAKKLSEDFSSIADLIVDKNFNEKISGDDKSTHHQLRLDILKFLIAMRPEIIEHLKDKDGLKLSWWYLYNGFNYNSKSDIPANLLEEVRSKLIVPDILKVSSKLWFIPNNSINFNFISEVLSKLDLWEFETNWTYSIYKNADSFYEFIQQNIKVINEDNEDASKSILVAKFISFMTSTNIRELRDLATIYLIEFGKKYPIALLEITEYSATLKDSYIYERLACCCYGVALILQNNEEYVNEHLSIIARRLYNLQFADNPLNPVYNYIIIDSIKHLLDLAVFKSLNDFNKDEIRRFSNFEFLPPHEWVLPTKKQSKLINESNGMDWPEPIGMDFGIYTIPRLMIKDYKDDRKAISNVYKRICELGYKDLEKEDFTEEEFREFYWGSSITGYLGKVDRLGKKYSWKGFFEYAGYLLLNKQLNVFEKFDGAKKHYERLGDVDIDICNPNPSYKLDLRIYPDNLMLKRDLDPEWYKETKIDTITPLFEHKIDNGNYIMLHGMVEQKLDKEYKVRSYILVDSFFIKRNDEINNLRSSIAKKEFDWDLDVHFSPDRLRNVYFGELYWADGVDINDEMDSVSIPTGKIITKKYVVTFQDTIHFGGYRSSDIGKEVEEKYSEKLFFNAENTLAEYLWESDSKTFKGFSEYLPSIKMGKYLQLKAEPSQGKILDVELNECFICVEHADNDEFNNTFNYMRSDLLRKYMAENDLLLIYQVKQHSYDENLKHNRGMKYFILE